MTADDDALAADEDSTDTEVSTDTSSAFDAVPTEPTEAQPAEPEPTGVRVADEARDRLTELSGASLEDHVDIYEDVHRRLHEGLADLDEN